MKKEEVMVLLNQIFVVTLLLCCSCATARAQDNKPLKIGVVLCLTGACQQTGTSSLNGLQLAREEINARGGILQRKVELVVQDSREMESAAHAVSAYRQLRLDPDISLFVGPSWSIGGLAVAPIVARDPVAMIATTIGLEKFNEAGNNIFNLWPHDSVATKALAKFALDKGWKRAAIISNSHPWESTLAGVFREEYKRLGGVESLFVEVQNASTDMRMVALKVKASKPDVVFMTNYADLGITAWALRDVRVDAATMTILLEDKQIEVAQGSLEGLIFCNYEDSTKDFVDRYLARFKISPDLGADTGYDALYLYKDAIERARSFDPKVLQGALLATELPGASGLIRFDQKGGVIKSPIFRQLRGVERARLQ